MQRIPAIPVIFVTALLCLFATATQASSPPAIPAGFDIYQEPIDTPQHLDWLWQDCLVHGQIKAIEKITTALRLNEYSGAIKKAQAIRNQRALTAEEEKSALLDAVFQAAMWSLETNAKQRPPVLAELKRIEQANRTLKDPAHGYLLILLTRVAPKEYSLIDTNNGLTFSTPSGEVRFQIVQ